MIITNNVSAARAYVPYTQTLSNLQKSAQRLATGNKFANASDGTGELGVADRMQLDIVGTNSVIATMENAIGYSSTQDDILSAVADIITRMNELAASAVDATKTATDRSALDAEFRSLDSEIANYALNSKYNGTNLFGTTTIRVGIEATNTVSFSAVNLAQLTFTKMSVGTVAAASAALISIKGRIGSLAVLRNCARSHTSRVERTLAFTRGYVANLSNAEPKIRDVDLAVETGTFTQSQVMVQAAQSVIAQINQLSTNVLRFLQ